MSDHQKKIIRRITFAVAAIGLLVPVTVSPTQGVEGNEACADGGCCRELNSVCMGDGGNQLHYYPGDGVCGPTKR